MATAKNSTSTAANAKKAQAAATRAHNDAKKAAEAVRKLGRVAKRGTGFMNFIREQGVIGLAVGLAIGTAAGATVKALVEGFITPIVQFIVGSQAGLEASVWHVSLWGRTADFKWGAFVSSAITLVSVAFVVYFIVKGLRLDKLDKAKEE